jgi:transmembrane sensor
MRNLDLLARRMAALQDDQLAAQQPHRGPASLALGEHLLHRSAERRRRRRLVQISTTIVLLAAGAFAGLGRWQRHNGSAMALVRPQAGQRIEASLLDLSLAFDDGSQVVLSSGSSLRTEGLGPSSAILQLERGRAHVRVVHTSATHWTVRAGAYDVAVTGTRFRVDWQPETGAFSVVVEEGRVRVSGGLLTQAVEIAAGQSLALEHGRPVSGAGTQPIEPERAAPQPAHARESEATPEGPAEMGLPLGAQRPSIRHATAPSWQQQALAGRYREAITEAERRGFEGVCRTASGADLLTLAEAARYAGRNDRAEQALRAVRDRFGQGEDAATAAYLLGRIAAEGRRDHAQAARWFRTYLGERPSGRLNREAEGRLLESLAFMDRQTAREAARVYLAHYPSGPHAAFARNLLGP